MDLINEADAFFWRILVCHKHPFSARLHFLVPENTGVVLPEPLPRLAVIAECGQDTVIQCHPSAALCSFQEIMGIKQTLEIVSDFDLLMEVPGHLVSIYLAALSGHDLFEPPEGTCWVELLQCVERPWLDREILRRAYEVLMG
ncbi:hypothetical protein [Azomonas macrocytogenes]|uniref:Uncharacterized protein n=1 Tax=Azomonas macrocytogenes TaxID=69962 RepID=A0A839T4I2_AZOMA|nr:hypothetical protein [Azomonas macrocytogenes]MBB3103909.1 hypothetical protein [Azomonas macrocytogenes]